MRAASRFAPDLTLVLVLGDDTGGLPGTDSRLVHDQPEELRLRPDVAVRTTDGCHFGRQKRVGLRRGDERDELDHGSAEGLGPLGPGVAGASLAGDGEEAVQVNIEGFVDGLVPVGEGHVLEALLVGDIGLGVGRLVAGVRDGVLVGEWFGPFGVVGAGVAGVFVAAHGLWWDARWLVWCGVMVW